MHVFGNAISGTIFLSAVNRRLGDGRGPLFVMGVRGPRQSVQRLVVPDGAPLDWGIDRSLWRGRSFPRRHPIGRRSQPPRAVVARAGGSRRGGLALLGMMGASPHSDLLAHLFGLGAGLLVGVFATLGQLKRGSAWVQVASALALVALVTGSWALAFHVPRGM